MSSVDPFAYTAENLNDPSVSAWTLAQVSANRPDLHRQVLVHPNCYPELAAWIVQQQSAPHSQAFKDNARGGDTWGNSVGSSLPDPHHFASHQRPVPQVWDAKVGKAPRVQAYHPVTPVPRGWFVGPVLTAAAGLIAFLSLFMPAVTTVLGYSVSFLNGPDGVVFVLLFLVVIGCSTMAVVVRHMAVRVASGVVGLVTGAAGLLYGFVTMVNIVGEETASVGIGALLLTIASVAILVGAAVTLFVRGSPRDPQWRTGPL